MQIVCKFDMSTPTIKVILDTRRALKPEREAPCLPAQSLCNSLQISAKEVFLAKIGVQV